MPDLPGEGLVPFQEAQAAIEPYRAGGIIERALGAPERSMDRIIHDHLGTLALLNARGDNVKERPTYVFNPDTGLLINFAYRRDENPSREGLFADIVELDENGIPRHGVSVVDPFATKKGFINVAVGDNENGFAPSHTDLRIDSEDLFATIPPNIETADLLAMLGQVSIDDDESLTDYIARRHDERETFRYKARQRCGAMYMGTVQSLDEKTNPDVHLIISERDDPSSLATASRQVGLFPIIISGEEVLAWHRKLKQGEMHSGALAESEAQIRHLLKFKKPELAEWVSKNNPGFVTFDLPDTNRHRDEFGRPTMVMVPSIGYDWDHGIEEGRKRLEDIAVGRFELLSRLVRGVIQKTSIFSCIINESLLYDKVEKMEHGHYEQLIDINNPESMQDYTDWLRKAKLDMAMTLYLRSISQL